MAYFYIFIGGGVGAILRYVLHMRIDHAVSANFPYGILTVNILGSFLIGVLAGIVSRETFSEVSYLSPLLMVGVLGGFTTFSTFSLETINLIQGGKYQAAMFYVLASVILSIFAAFLGLMISK